VTKIKRLFAAKLQEIDKEASEYKITYRKISRRKGIRKKKAK
jgi:hypothetical protein